jgi:hypothetical protein
MGHGEIRLAGIEEMNGGTFRVFGEISLEEVGESRHWQN